MLGSSQEPEKVPLSQLIQVLLGQSLQTHIILFLHIRGFSRTLLPPNAGILFSKQLRLFPSACFYTKQQSAATP